MKKTLRNILSTSAVVGLCMVPIGVQKLEDALNPVVAKYNLDLNNDNIPDKIEVRMNGKYDVYLGMMRTSFGKQIHSYVKIPDYDIDNDSKWIEKRIASTK